MARPEGIRFLALALAGSIVWGITGILWALNPNNNRPCPLMDYAPQEIGMYDTIYAEITEEQCRACHGNSLADRHHNSDFVLVDGSCEPCHELIDEAPRVVVFKSCITDQGTAGCHSWTNAKAGTNGWHHKAPNWDEPDSCIICHNPNLVGPIGDFRPFDQYPPSIVTPTVFMCENCHWEQAATASAGGNPFDSTTVEHPATYNHFNIWDQGPMYFEYERDIKGNYDTHHMGFEAGFVGPCDNCHGKDPNDDTWDPNNPELIRYCEVCHDIGTLHTLQMHPDGTDQPHVGTYSAWEAVGFHDPDPEADPSTYKSVYPEEQCFSCHGDMIPDPPCCWDSCRGYVPAINHLEGISPASGTCSTYVTLRGQNFGDTKATDSLIQMRKSDLYPWTNVLAYTWTDTEIVFEIPCGAFARGNYKVRVQTTCGNSNQVVFALKDWPAVVIKNAYTCNDSGQPQTVFAPQEPIQYRIVYDVQGDPGTQYKATATITAFGKTYRTGSWQYPGTDYLFVKDKVVRSTAVGKTKTIKYKAKLKVSGQLLDVEKATSQITVAGP